MLKSKLRVMLFSVLVSARMASAGLEPASISGYSAFTSAKVSLVITDENGYMGVLLTKLDNPTDKVWLWNVSDSRCTPDGYKSMLSTALSALSQGALVNAIVITATQNYVFPDAAAKGSRTATNRISSFWIEGP